MRTGSRSVVATLAAAVALSAAAARADAVEPVSIASCAGPREGSVSAGAGGRFSQSFTPRVSGALTAVDLALMNPPGTSGDWVVEIHLATRLPIGNFEQYAVASTTVPDAAVPTGASTVTATFARPAVVFPGVAPRQEYELVVARTGPDGPAVGYRGGNACDGVLGRGAGSDVFTPLGRGDADLVFTAYAVDVAPPVTRIARGPRKRTSRHRARFELRASEPVAGFRCRLDREPAEPCGPTERVRVGRGRHMLRATAIDLAGNADPTPARLRWRVTGRAGSAGTLRPSPPR